MRNQVLTLTEFLIYLYMLHLSLKYLINYSKHQRLNNLRPNSTTTATKTDQLQSENLIALLALSQ